MPRLSRRPTKTRPSSNTSYRSGLEERVAQELEEQNVDFDFEKMVIEYLKPARISKYTPDFVLKHNDIVIETKGQFVTADRQKHLLVQKQHPHLDIRFVFSRSKDRISKQSKTTYAMWCEKNGFLYADKSIPDEWIKEKK